MCLKGSGSSGSEKGLRLMAAYRQLRVATASARIGTERWPPKFNAGRPEGSNVVRQLENVPFGEAIQKPTPRKLMSF